MKKRLNDMICDISIGVLCCFTLVIAVFLSYYSLRYSYYSPTDYTIPVYPVRDSAGANLLSFGLVLMFSVFLNRLFKRFGERERLAGYIYLGAFALFFAAVGLFWVFHLHYYPNGDQLNVTAAAHYNLSGLYVMFKKTGYLGKFPYQKGLTFFYEILFTLFGHYCFRAIAVVHVLSGAVTMIFGYLFIEETSAHRVCKLLYCPLVALCAPYMILMPYTYGDLPSVCLGTVFIYALHRFSRTGKLLSAALACVTGTLSLFMRMHTWILLIAALIGMSFVSLQKKKIAPVLLSVLVCVCATASLKLLDISYAMRSGYEITEGAPMVLTLAMGLQDNENGPGTYNNYQTATLSRVDYDNDAAAEIAKANIQKRLRRFAKDKPYAWRFFKTKLLMQWNEPTFETLISTHSFDEDALPPEWIGRIYTGDLHDVLTGFADRYMSVVYLGFLCAVPVFLKRRKGDLSAYIPLIAIVGGFLFSIIWESQCRYVLPYYLMMLYYVPDGVCFALDAAKTVWHKTSSALSAASKKDPAG